MRILHLTEHYVPFFGGVEYVLHEINRRLVRDGFDVEVVCEQELGRPKDEVIDGVKVHHVFGFELIKIKYGVGRVAPQMVLSGVKYRPDIIHAHSYGFFPTWASVFTGKPTLLTTHSDPAARIYPFFDLFREVPLRLCDHVVATTELEKQHLQKRGVNPKKITVIPNGIAFPSLDIPKFDFSPMIFCLARLDIAHKGQDILLTAMKKVVSVIPNAKLFVSGYGQDLQKLKNLTKKLGLERNVVFTGAVDQSTKEVYMKNCDVFCVSPRTESFGVVYLEAMSYGKPIVTTNVGGVPEVLGDVAILVPPDDSSSLANALITVLTEKTKAASFGTRGIQRAKQFNWEIIANKYEDLYRKLLNPQVESYNTQPTPLVPDIFPDQTETQLISSSKKQRKHK